MTTVWGNIQSCVFLKHKAYLSDFHLKQTKLTFYELLNIDVL